MALWNLKDKTILIVDDFAEMRSLMRSMIMAYGAERIELTSNGEDAINIMQSRRFDIVLCDYNLGKGRDGQQVLEEVKRRDLLACSTAFVLVTAENTSQMVLGALEHQPDGYIAKPVTKTVLQVRLKKLLEKKADLRDIYQALDRKQFGKLIECCDRHVEAGSRYRLELLKIKSDVLIEVGDYAQADAVCRMVAAERELPWATFDIGRIYFHRRQFHEAAEVFSRVIEQNSCFVSAYDWLATTQECLGDPVLAQRTLMDAIEKSSKSLLRLRALANVADRNEDHEVAETARRKAIRVGKGSVLRRPSDYTRLAGTLVARGAAKDALKVVESMKYEFRACPQAELEAAVAGNKVQAALGNEKISRASLERAIDLASQHPDLIAPQVGVELSQACLSDGRGQDAEKFVSYIVKNNHDNQELLNEIARIYRAGGAEREIGQLIANAQAEVDQINREGERLLKEGRLEASLGVFSKAAKAMPHNPVINLNAAQSLIRMMTETQPTRSALEETLAYIQAADNSDAYGDRKTQLLAACRELSACL